MIPLLVLDRWRADARRVIADPGAPESLRRLAWMFFRQWGFRDAKLSPAYPRRRT